MGKNPLPFGIGSSAIGNRSCPEPESKSVAFVTSPPLWRRWRRARTRSGWCSSIARRERWTWTRRTGLCGRCRPSCSRWGCSATRPGSRCATSPTRWGFARFSSTAARGRGTCARLRHLRIIKALGFEAGRTAEQLDPWRSGRDQPRGHPARHAPRLADARRAHRRVGRLLRLVGPTPSWSAGLFEHLPPRILAGGLNPENVADAIASRTPLRRRRLQRRRVRARREGSGKNQGFLQRGSRSARITTKPRIRMRSCT